MGELKLWSILPTKIDPWLQLFGLIIAGSPILWFFSKHNKDFTEMLSEIDKHSLGGRGEKEVYKRLMKLGTEFCVIPNIYPGKRTGKKLGDVDIVVVSFKGIVAIEVKAVTNFIALRYFMKSNIRKAKNKAGLISALIKQELGGSYYVKPMLVFAGPSRDYTKEINNQTLVVGVNYINNEILGIAEHHLSNTEIKRIADILRTYR